MSDENRKIVCELTGCTIDEANAALDTWKDDVIAAIDSLLTKPVVSGERFIPSKPKLNSGMSEEQEDRCKRGRELQDKVNAVFSVAHSKIQQPLADQVPEESEILLPTTQSSLE
jgi:hypothetical protein